MSPTEASSEKSALSRSEESELRAAVQYSVIQLCAEEDASSATRMSPKAIAALAELTYLYAVTSLASDLEAFAGHAGRKTISDADVKLAARKIPQGLLSKLEDFCREHVNSSTNTVSGTKTRKKKKKSLSKYSSKERVYEADDDDSSSSSSDDVDLLAMDIEGSRNGIASKIRSALAARKSTDASDDSMDCEVLEQRPPLGKKKQVYDSLDDSSTDSNRDGQAALKKAVAEPKRRFRLQNNKKSDASGGRTSSSEDDDLLADPFPDKKPSKVQQIIDDLSEDSVG